MSNNEGDKKTLLPHHVQMSLCTTRLPYRQGRKLTAVKVYTINDESKHLLIFGVPSLNLRQETKALFLRFGKLLQFNISTKHNSPEPFTETYHAFYERIQSARMAKRMLDTKNFYGGSLHVAYAPELESLEETTQKLFQRQRDVCYRLRNLEKEKFKAAENKVISDRDTEIPLEQSIETTKVNKLNMAEINTICIGKQIRDVVYKKRKAKEYPVEEKRFKPCFIDKPEPVSKKEDSNQDKKNIKSDYAVVSQNAVIYKDLKNNEEELQVVDCTSVEKETVTNINETLNYNNFGNEVIKKIEQKPMNVVKFCVRNKNT